MSGLSRLVAIVAVSLLTWAQPVESPTAQPNENPSARLQDRTFQSESLSREMKYRILLPADYGTTTNRYPVLYLLHGWHGDFQNWSTLTKLTQYAESLPMIVVMPDAGDSWYTDSATVPQDKFEQYVAHDLVGEIDRQWRTLRSSDRRAIAGLSMGGYGAVKLALKYPEMFRVAASLSGGFDAGSPELEKVRTDLQPSLARAFGPAQSETRAQNDVYRLAEHADVQSKVYLYIDCGNEDSFLEENRKLAAILSRRKFSYEYHEYPGGHSWEYWDQHLPDVLRAVRTKIRENDASSIATRLSFPYAEGWLGADDAYSISFAPGKSIWLFGDTFAGEPGTKDRGQTTMVRNSVGVTTCVGNKKCAIQYYWKKTAEAKLRSFFDTGKEDEWYWPMDGYLDGDTLYVSLMIVRNRPGAGPADPFGFEIDGTRWAKASNALAPPDEWKISIKDLTKKDLWPGSSIVRDGDYVLFYTQASQGEGKGYMILLRVPVKKIADPEKNWEYLGKDAKWHAGLPHGDAQVVIDQAISEMSVRYHPSAKRWVAILPGTPFPSKQVIARTADSPLGPWSKPQVIYEFPEMNPTNPGYDKDTFCYATKEHTEFAESKIVLTYACNSSQLQKVMKNLEIYRPQVVVLDLPE